MFIGRNLPHRSENPCDSPVGGRGAANAAPLAKFGARFLVRGGKTECVGGAMRARNVVIEFESYEKALACWNSPEYRRAANFRQPPIADGDFIIGEGYDGPQPGGASSSG